MTKHRFGFKLTNWWEKQSAYNSLCDLKRHHMLKKEKGKKNTVLVCHAWLRWLVTNLTQLSYWWRKTDAVTCSQRLVWKFPAFIRTQTGVPKLLDILISLSGKEVYFSSSTLVTSTKGWRSGWIFWMCWQDFQILFWLAFPFGKVYQHLEKIWKKKTLPFKCLWSECFFKVSCAHSGCIY